MQQTDGFYAEQLIVHSSDLTMTSLKQLHHLFVRRWMLKNFDLTFAFSHE